MIKDIFEKVVEIMETLKGTGEPLSEVYGYPESHPTLFPCAIMDVDAGMTTEDYSSMTKNVTVNVIVRILIRQRNAQEATLHRLDIIDSLLTRFTTTENIDDLDGVADIVDITSIEPMFVAGAADQPFFGFDVVITAKKLLRAN